MSNTHSTDPRDLRVDSFIDSHGRGRIYRVIDVRTGRSRGQDHRRGELVRWARRRFPASRIINP